MITRPKFSLWFKELLVAILILVFFMALILLAVSAPLQSPRIAAQQRNTPMTKVTPLPTSLTAVAATNPPPKAPVADAVAPPEALPLPPVLVTSHAAVAPVTNVPPPVKTVGVMCQWNPSTNDYGSNAIAGYYLVYWPVLGGMTNKVLVTNGVTNGVVTGVIGSNLLAVNVAYNIGVEVFDTGSNYDMGDIIQFIAPGYLLIAPSNNMVALQFLCFPNKGYTLQTSTNLTNWTSKSAFTNNSGVLTCTDAVTNKAGFYRLLIQ